MRPVPPVAEMDTDPLLEPKQVTLICETFAIVGDAWLAMVVDVVKLQPFASRIIML